MRQSFHEDVPCDRCGARWRIYFLRGAECLCADCERVARGGRVFSKKIEREEE
jgi:hypothetical protein